MDYRTHEYRCEEASGNPTPLLQTRNAAFIPMDKAQGLSAAQTGKSKCCRLAREFLTCSLRISKIDVPRKFLTSSISVQINVTFEVHP